MSESAGTDDTAEPAEPADGQPGTGEDEQKRKFREALERKSGGKGGGTDAHGQSKVHGAQGPAKSQRSFRRKSGG